MSKSVIVRMPETLNCASFVIPEDSSSVDVCEEVLLQRFGLGGRKFSLMLHDASANVSTAVLPTEWAKANVYTLFFSKTYDIVPHLDSCNSKSCETPATQVEGQPVGLWEGIPYNPHLISAYADSIIIKGHSQLAKLNIHEFPVERVVCLPSRYNDNIVFELPPVLHCDAGKKGGQHDGIDRKNDPYLWSRMFSTTARIGASGQYSVMRVDCGGSFMCKNETCPAYTRSGLRNVSDWKVQKESCGLWAVGMQVPPKTICCGHCQEACFLVARCSASMFYILPSHSVTNESRSLMSRLVVHTGHHGHSARTTNNRAHVQSVKEALKKAFRESPLSPASSLRNTVTNALYIKMFENSWEEGMSEEDKLELLDTMSVIANPSLFANMLRSIRKQDGPAAEVDALLRMQKDVKFPLIQRSLFIGQASAEAPAHVFKMTTTGPSSGLDLILRMRRGGDLFGAWIASDITHRSNCGWLTMAAHVYDHHLRALCTIFTCELRAESSRTLEVPWRKMLEVVAEHDDKPVEIAGFMADNAQAAWIAIRNVFWDGRVCKEKERSDEFHWSLSLEKHTQDGVFPHKRAEHKELWRQMKDAKTLSDAYCKAGKIRDWWSAGNALPSKVRVLTGWLYWWMSRFHQWGNYVREGLSVEKSALMPNCNGSESVNASMKRPHGEQKMSLLQICQVDLARGILQVGRGHAFQKGKLSGRGPSILALRLRATDLAGTPASFVENANALLRETPMYVDTSSLNGDVFTKSVRRKTCTGDYLSPNDSHRPDKTLHTMQRQRRSWNHCQRRVPCPQDTPNIDRHNCAEDRQEKRPSSSEVTANEGCIGKATALELSSSSDTEEIGKEDSEECVIVDNDAARETARPDEAEAMNLNENEAAAFQPANRANVARRLNFVTQDGQEVVEKKVDSREFHVRRIARVGRGPACRARFDDRSHRQFCSAYVRNVGVPHPFNGVAAICFFGKQRDGFGIIRESKFWFCPKIDCCRTLQPRGLIGRVPIFPSYLPIAQETFLTQTEVDVFNTAGLMLSTRTLDHTAANEVPHSRLLRVDVNGYAEKACNAAPCFVFDTRGGRPARRRFRISISAQQRVQRSRNLAMKCVERIKISTGNGRGYVLKLAYFDGQVHKDYIVQICFFPSCSCDDFFDRETRSTPFCPCKHLYWCYENMFHLDLGSEMLVHQPALSRNEVDWIVERIVAE